VIRLRSVYCCCCQLHSSKSRRLFAQSGLSDLAFCLCLVWLKVAADYYMLLYTVFGKIRDEAVSIADKVVVFCRGSMHNNVVTLLPN